MSQRAHVPVVLSLLAVASLAGCAQTPPADGAAGAPVLGWPHPTGDEWPLGLDGPFELREILLHVLERPDGVGINGWVLLPDLPKGVGAPVILEMGPYFDNEDQPTGSTQMHPGQEPSRPLEWVEQGYAVAFFSVRGTGRSEGCFSMGGPDEQKDVAAVVEWLAEQPWSNGRVGMIGLSYPGFTPWQAAIHHPKGLAAMAVMGTIIDMQWFFETPNHEPYATGAAFGALYGGRVSVRPSLDAAAPLRHIERVCKDSLQVLQGGRDLWYSDDHDAQWWKDRRYRDEIPNTTVAMFLQQGLDDAYLSGHMVQDMYLWDLVEAPKRLFEGQWGHETPPAANIEGAYPNATYTSLTMEWMDYFLKGLGTPEDAGVGLAEYEDNTGAWHASDAWPPTEAGAATLYPAGGKTLANASNQGQSSFSARPAWGASDGNPCPSIPGATPDMVAYTTSPASERTLVAGNPVLEVLLESDRPSGSLHARLHRVTDDGGDGCQTGQWQDFAWAGADVRFYEGGQTGRDFPVGVPTALRLDFNNVAEMLEPGQRLGLTLSGSEVFFRPPLDYPDYVVHEGAQTVLRIPVASGELL